MNRTEYNEIFDDLDEDNEGMRTILYKNSNNLDDNDDFNINNYSDYLDGGNLDIPINKSLFYDLMVEGDNNSDKMIQLLEKDKYNEIKKLHEIMDEELCKQIIIYDPFNIIFILNQTFELCMYSIARVEDEYNILKLIRNQNYELVLYCVSINVYNLKYVNKHFLTKELCLLIIYKSLKSKENMYFLEYIPEQYLDLELYKKILKNYDNIKYIKNQTNEILDLIPIDKLKTYIQYINNIEYLIEKQLIEINNLSFDECLICNDIKKYYYYYYSCKKHSICVECSKKTKLCYYKCNKHINYYKLYINDNYV